MAKSVIAQTVGDELRAAADCLVAAMNNLAGPYGKAYSRSTSDLYYACYHLANALLASRGIGATSHEAVQKLLALHFVKPAALPADTNRKFNELMDKRHAADYKPFVPIGAEDVAAFKPWIAAFARDALKLLGKAAPPAELKTLHKALADFDRLAVE